MSNVVIKNSIVVAALLDSVFVNALFTAGPLISDFLKAIDDRLHNAFTHSAFKSGIRGTLRVLNIFFMGSIVMGFSATIILKVMLFLEERAKKIFFRLYNGSVFMSITGEAVINSRIIRRFYHDG